MNEKIPLELGEGRRIWVELAEKPLAETADLAANPAPEYYRRSRELGEAVEVIRPLVDKITEPLKTLASKPKEIQLEFGFRFSSDAEVVLTASKDEALVKVVLTFGPEGAQ
ncbi:MAG: CU044_2847 family protein [bacterium]|nr:CU044_2847 family protein [bacterium]